jgi:hypothetical protein
MRSPCRKWVNRCVSIEAQRRPMSVVSPIGDKLGRSRFVRFVPLATNAPQQTAQLLDHLVGQRYQFGRHTEAESPCRLEVDDQFELGRLYDR